MAAVSPTSFGGWRNKSWGKVEFWPKCQKRLERDTPFRKRVYVENVKFGREMVQYEAIRTLKIGELLASFGASSSWGKNILFTLCNISSKKSFLFLAVMYPTFLCSAK